MAETVTFAPTTVGAFIEQDLGRARTLHGYGISLFGHAGKPLEDVCRQMGLVPMHLLTLIDQQARMCAPRMALHEMPTRLIIEYLRHAHHLFIRERLPFLLYLVGGLEASDGPGQAMAQDLRLIFPLFAEEFIEHIHEEEDTLFGYIAELERASRRIDKPGNVWQLLEKHSIGQFASDHQIHDDELAGIRALAGNYAIHAGMPLPQRVLYHELALFEQDLAAHAALENHILLPKALRLEGYVRSGLVALAKRN